MFIEAYQECETKSLTNYPYDKLRRGTVHTNNEAVVHDFLVGEKEGIVEQCRLEMLLGVLADIKWLII